MVSSTSPTRFGFLLFPGFPMACLTSAIEPLRAANEISGDERFSWELISEDGDPVSSSANVVFHPELSLSEHENIDALIILSAPDGAFSNMSKVNGKLRYLARHGVILGGVSGGVFPLAQAGLLDGHRCSIHWCYKTAFQTKFPQLEATEDVITFDRRIYTAAGAAAAFDMMLKIVEDSLGNHVMTEVACWFQHPVVRSEGVPQKVPTFRSDTTTDELPNMVEKAVAIFTDHLEFTLSVRDVSTQVGVSSRQLERIFKAALGISPMGYYRILRMHAARQLLVYSDATVTDVARSVGYSGSSTFSRNYLQCFGIRPMEERKRKNGFRAIQVRHDQLPKQILTAEV